VNITAAVLCHNLHAHDRLDLFWQTWESLHVEGVRVIPVDNGSTDSTDELVADLGGYVSKDRLTTCGHGTNLCARVAIGTDADLCVLSDDDMRWLPGWAEQLRAWWSAAPDDVLLTGCHVEPVFSWNEIHGRIVCGGVPGLIRASTGAASWSFLAGDWPRIGPVPDRIQGWGDVPTCQRITDAGYRVAQLNLAEHAGHGRSTWGNRTVEMHGWDIDPALARLEVP